MSAIISAPPVAASLWPGLLDRLRQAEPTFYTLAVLNLMAIAPTLFAAYLDSRSHLGIDNWVKPLKFQIALAIYTLTLAFFARSCPAE